MCIVLYFTNVFGVECYPISKYFQVKAGNNYYVLRICMHSLRSARILEPIVTFVVPKAAAGGEEELGEGLRLLF